MPPKPTLISTTSPSTHPTTTVGHFSSSPCSQAHTPRYRADKRRQHNAENRYKFSPNETLPARAVYKSMSQRQTTLHFSLATAPQCLVKASKPRPKKLTHDEATKLCRTVKVPQSPVQCQLCLKVFSREHCSQHHSKVVCTKSAPFRNCQPTASANIDSSNIVDVPSLPPPPSSLHHVSVSDEITDER